MREIGGCFFCYTPYQIMAAIAIAREKYQTSDLYIFFSAAEGYADKIRKKNIFSEIRVFPLSEKKNSKIVANLRIVKAYLQYSDIAKAVLIPDTRYIDWYVSTRNLVDRCVFFYYLKRGISIKRIHYDDGAGSYFNGFLTYIGKKDAILRRILFGKQALEKISQKMLYCPNLYFSIHDTSTENIEKINGHFENEDVVKLYNDIFDFNSRDLIKEKVLLIDCKKEEFLNSQGQHSLDTLYRIIFKVCHKNNVIVKRHPRDTEEKKEGINYYINYQLPIECLFMNMDCNSKILISATSTSVVTPKVLFNQEPYVILLYKMLQFNRKDMDLENIDPYYQNCKKIYSKPERFMIPENEDELRHCLEKMMES